MNRCYAGLAAIAAWIGLTSFAWAQGPVRPSSTLIYLAKGGPHACGPGCDTWIVFNGEINQRRQHALCLADAEARRPQAALRHQFARRQRRRCDGDRAVACDKMECARLSGRTMPKNCTPTDLRRMQSGDIGRHLHRGADHRPALAVLHPPASGLLLGGAEREVPPSARIGIHSGKIYFTARGKVDPSTSRDPGTRRAGEECDASVAWPGASLFPRVGRQV